MPSHLSHRARVRRLVVAALAALAVLVGTFAVPAGAADVDPGVNVVGSGT